MKLELILRLPNDARIDAKEFREVLGISKSAFYNRLHRKQVPEPCSQKVGFKQKNYWRASVVRKYLRGLK